jgi:hypothetical protein
MHSHSITWRKLLLVLPAVAVAVAFSCGVPKTDDAKEKEDDDADGDGFTLTVTGTDFDSHHHDATAMFALVDRTAHTVKRLDDLTIHEGDFVVTATGALIAGHDYFFDYLIDVNHNGQCDAPPADHPWRRKIDAVSGDVSITEVHNMAFTDVCESFKGTAPSVPAEGALLVTGVLTLDSGVAADETLGIEPGQALVGATVFLEGDPTNEARTDSQGAFTLAIDPGAALAAGGKPTLVMWYTVPSAGHSSTDWASAAARFGVRKELDMAASAGDAVELGSVPLTYTSAVKFLVKDEASSDAVSACWIDFPDYSFQLVVLELPGAVYSVDYLPPGTYNVRIACGGYADKVTEVTVGTSTAADQVQDLGAMTVTKAP